MGNNFAVIKAGGMGREGRRGHKAKLQFNPSLDKKNKQTAVSVARLKNEENIMHKEHIFYSQP